MGGCKSALQLSQLGKSVVLTIVTTNIEICTYAYSSPCMHQDSSRNYDSEKYITDGIKETIRMFPSM